MGSNKFGEINKKMIIALAILTVVTALGGYFLYKWYIKNNPPSNFGRIFPKCDGGYNNKGGKCVKKDRK